MKNLFKIQALEDLPNGESKYLFILFHGYGADAYDLRSLNEVIQMPPQSTQWAFPQGILKVPIGPGWQGHAWWPIDMAALERAAQTGEDRQFSNLIPNNMEALRNSLLTWIEDKKFNWSQVMLGGFSQGAMLATDLFLHAKENPMGLVILSGALINKSQWEDKILSRPNRNVFISHGKQDPIIPCREADKLESFFLKHQYKVSKVLFDGQHEIPPLVINKLNQWIKTEIM